MYRALQQEFQSDKVAKLKSDQIDCRKEVLKQEEERRRGGCFQERNIKESCTCRRVEEEKPEPVVVVETVLKNQRKLKNRQSS